MEGERADGKEGAGGAKQSLGSHWRSSDDHIGGIALSQSGGPTGGGNRGRQTMECTQAHGGRRAEGAGPGLEEGLFPFRLSRRDSYMSGPGTQEEEEQEGEEGLRRTLRQRDEELHLAAELGKALLERSEGLGREKEQLEQELERLRQESHEQRQRLEAQQSEREARVDELEMELRERSAALGRGMGEWRWAERQRAQAARERGDNKERLEEQLSEADVELGRLRGRVREMEEAAQDRTLYTQLLTQIQALQAENEELVELSQRSEDQVQELVEENRELRIRLENLHDNQKTLETLNHERGQQVLQAQRDVEEFKSVNDHLRISLQEAQKEMSIGQTHPPSSSLHSEIRESTDRDDPGPSDRQGGGGQEEKELAALREEVASLRQLLHARYPDQVLQQAIHSRDQAIHKKRQLEAEVERVRVERDSLSRQLLHVVRQKMQLSEDLEAWQEDMQVILSQQLQSQQHQEGWSSLHRVGDKIPHPAPSPEQNSPSRDSRGFLSLFRKS